MENYEQKLKIGTIVKGVRTFNGEIIEGKFNGFHLYNKLNPKSVVGVIDTGERFYDVFVDSIEFVESEDEKIRKALIRNFTNQHSSNFPTVDGFTREQILNWLEKPQEHSSCGDGDIAMIQDAIHWINEFQKSDRCKDENDMQNSVTCENWLKSFKPQIARWRPSEYDISLLEEIARNIRNDVRPFCSEVSALEDLINNIKTL